MEEEALFVTENVAETVAETENVAETTDTDPVVAEIPVFLNNHAGDSLVLFQYPTRKSSQANRVSGVRLKPASQTVETDLESDIPAGYIDSQVNGSAMMGIKQTYSGVLNPNKGRFAAGYIHENALHLSLVPRTGQLRPKFASKSSTLLQPSMLQAKQAANAQGASLKDVQYSVKPTSTEGPKHSGVLDFWRQANKEQADDYACSELDEAQKHAMLVVNEEEAADIECENAAAKMTFL